MDICVIEWIILSLFSDFHSSTLLKNDELRICYKRINHSIIQSFNHSIICYWFLSLLKVRLIDWLTYCLNQRIVNEPINTWMDKRCSFYAVNNNYKIIITNKLLFCYKDIVYSIFLSFSHLLLFLSRECMIEGLNRCLCCMLLSIHVQQTTRQIAIATTMKLVKKMDINIVDW